MFTVFFLFLAQLFRTWERRKAFPNSLSKYPGTLCSRKASLFSISSISSLLSRSKSTLVRFVMGVIGTSDLVGTVALSYKLLTSPTTVKDYNFYNANLVSIKSKKDRKESGYRNGKEMLPFREQFWLVFKEKALALFLVRWLHFSSYNVAIFLHTGT